MVPYEVRRGSYRREGEGERGPDSLRVAGAHGHDQREVGQNPEYPALDVLLEDGRTQLFWHHELEEIGEGA